MLRSHYVLAQGNNVFTFKWVSKRSNLIANASKPPDISFKVILLIFYDFWSEVKWCPYTTKKSCIWLNDLRNS